MLPVLSLLLAASLWGLVWYPLRLLQVQGMNGLWVSFIAFSAAVLASLPWLWRSGPDWRANGRVLFLMSLSIGWCNVAFVLAIIDGTVVRVLLLFYLAPLWALMLGWLLLRETPGRQDLMVFVLAIAGAVTMLWNPDMGLPWPRGEADWLAVSSGLAFSFANVMVRKMRGVSLQGKAAANWLGVALVAGVWILAARDPLPQAALSVWFGAVLLGWLGFMLMTLTVIYGVTHMPVHRSAVILLFELVIGAVSSLLLTDEVVSPQEWTGGGLIVLAAYLSARVHVHTKACNDYAT